MHKLVIRNWQDESVVYNIESGDMHLMPVFHSELLQLLIANQPLPLLVVKIVEMYKVNTKEAEKYLDDLYHEFLLVNLIVKK